MSERAALARGLAEAYMDGAVSLPYALLRSYRMLGLTDTECMLLIQLLAYRQLEQNEFPTMEQLQERLGMSQAEVGKTMQRLLKMGFIAIDDVVDPISGVQSERYNLAGLFSRIADLLSSGELPLRAGTASERPGGPQPAVRGSALGAGPANRPGGETDLYSVFEQEFGRPLTPMECETIANWYDQDGYPAELILFALKEAVFAGKLHFRYIDRILLEWSRNRVESVDDARAHVQKFRSGKG
ncbi:MULTISPECIES: DnaD domain-containing protein [Cohnella]|jgi:DNA replication protein|uniref:DnaD domain-containing protein n=1 Tax=Cohnella TaxID=329857 RepID=UPI000369E648|nr:MULTISPECIES: DnaD domain-containing protein [Cohnella]REK66179.1 MAG: DnaD domain protein [Cohnella sp.]